MSLLDHQLIVTINRRLARELVERYSDCQKDAGAQVWESPQILPWSSWLTSLWRQDLDQASEQPLLLLNSTQSRVIWEGIIRYSSAANGLLQIGETTRVAMEAWRLLHEYDLDFDQIKPRIAEHNIDTQAFYEWAAAYQERLDYKHWVDQETLPARLIERVECGRLRMPDQLLLAGFDELTPVQQKFLTRLKEKGCQTETYQTEKRQTKAVRLACKDANHELQLTASRVRYLLEQNPTSKIGVVIPDLHKRKVQVKAVFEDILLPEAILPATEISRPFNMTLGDPLISFPVIKTAFLVLSSASGRLALDDLSRLLRSPFIAGGESEMSQRCLLDAQLRQYGDDSVGLPLVIKEASCEEELWYCPTLAAILEAASVAHKASEPAKKQSLVEWIERFDAILELMGWPDQGRSLSSAEHQTLESWRSVREQCVALETVTREMTYSTALQHLRKIATDQIFQPETEKNLPIEIMGLLESTGLRFDHLLVLGMTDDQWPAKPSPNPFLPLKIQHEKKMLHATAEVELAFARSITERLKQSAPDIIFTCPKQAADQALRPSPLIKSLPEIKEADIEISKLPDYRKQMRSSVTLEQLADNQTRPLPENIIWKGGTGIFKDQAACPFRAFVRHRLKAQPLGVAESGLNPAERGSLVHDALEILWGKLETQDKLIKLSTESLKKEIRHAVETAFKEFHSGKSVVQEEQFQKLEIDRLERLLAEWLAVEKRREPFTVVAREQAMKLTMGGISVNARVDRIDQLQAGELALIDYKTGEVATKSWEGERPDEPQLPLYAVGMEETPEAVLFAKVKKGDPKYVGLSSVEGIVKKVHQDWDQQITAWRETLENLAGQFVRGEAWVDPKDNTTCQYCTYQSLCRIDEIAGQIEMEQSDDDRG